MSYCIKTIKFIVNMELYWDVFVQQIIKQIGDIQNIDSFEYTWKKFDTCVIVILSYEHKLSFHYILNFDL
jgi:hypothetical protein